MTTKKILSVLICLVMVLSLMPMAAFATETPCVHEQAHLNGQHTTECGYNAGARCQHLENKQHDDSCKSCEHQCTEPGCVLAKAAVCVHPKHFDDGSCYTNCKHEHTAACDKVECKHNAHDSTCVVDFQTSKCNHICSEETGCIVKEANCQHTHTDECCRHNCETYPDCTPAVEAKCNHTHTDACYANCPHANGTHDTNCGYVDASPCTFECTECSALNTPTSPNLAVDLSKYSVPYNGAEQKPVITSVKSGETDVHASDYSVSYTRNGTPTTDFTNAGTITVTVTGSENSSYNGKTGSAQYVIYSPSVVITVTLDEDSYVHTGSAITPTLTVTHSLGGQLSEKDYEATYENNVNVGTAKVTVRPKAGGNFIFAPQTKNFEITAASTTPEGTLTITAAAQTITYGSAIDTTKYSVSGTLPTNATVSVTLTPSISNAGVGSISASNAVIKDANGKDISADYTISYVSGVLTISPKEVTTPTIKLDRTSYGYTGKAVEPTVTAVYDGNTLIPASEYTVSYENNVNQGSGTGIVRISDKTGGNYTVSGYTTFTIASNVKYNVVLGNGGCWYRDSYYGLGFRCDGPYSDFLGLAIDGQPVDRSYYMVSEGSTNVGLYPQLLNLLGNGTHYITFKYTSGSATGVFYVGSTAINAVMTGDDSNVGVLALVMCLGLLSSVSAFMVLRKKNGAR